MDTIAFVSGLVSISSHLSEISEFAPNLDSNHILDFYRTASEVRTQSLLQELPVLHELLPEVSDRIIRSPVPPSKPAEMALKTCMERSRVLDEYLKAYSPGKSASRKAKFRSVVMHMTHLNSPWIMLELLRGFKESVLILRDIAMDEQTHVMLQNLAKANANANANELPVPPVEQDTGVIIKGMDVNFMLPGFVVISRSRDRLAQAIAKLKAAKEDQYSNHEQMNGLTEELEQVLEVPALPYVRFKVDSGSDFNIVLEKFLAENHISSLKQPINPVSIDTYGGITKFHNVVELTWSTGNNTKPRTDRFHVASSGPFDLVLGAPYWSGIVSDRESGINEQGNCAATRQIRRDPKIKKAKLRRDMQEEEASYQANFEERERRYLQETRRSARPGQAADTPVDQTAQPPNGNGSGPAAVESTEPQFRHPTPYLGGDPASENALYFSEHTSSSIPTNGSARSKRSQISLTEPNGQSASAAPSRYMSSARSPERSDGLATQEGEVREEDREMKSKEEALEAVLQTLATQTTLINRLLAAQKGEATPGLRRQ